MNSEERIDFALEVIKRGEPFSIGELNFVLDSTDKNTVIVTFKSSWRIDFVTKERANKDLDEANNILNSLRQSYDSLNKYLSKMKLRLRIVDDYGMGGQEICYQDKEVTIYMEGLPD